MNMRRYTIFIICYYNAVFSLEKGLPDDIRIIIGSEIIEQGNFIFMTDIGPDMLYCIYVAVKSGREIVLRA